MLKNYFKIAVRNLFKQKVFSLFNLTGLALGISCGLLLALHIKEELSYEKDFPKHDRIYRIVTTEWAKSSPPLAAEMKQFFPEIEHTARFASRGKQVVNTVSGMQGESTGYYADASVIDMFDLKPLAGNPARALEEPFAAVISRKMAKQFFGKADPVGRKLIFDNKEEIWVRGVIDDLPGNSHLQFDYLVSMPTFYKTTPEDWTGNRGWMFGWTYVLLNQRNEVHKAEKRIGDFFIKFLSPEGEEDVEWVQRYASTVSFQPLTDIHLRSNLIQEMGTNSSILYIYIFATLEILILVIACVNFINLFTTQALKRAKEVGMRKALGAGKAQLVLQFLGEAFILTVLAGLVALCIYFTALPFYNDIAGKAISGLEIFRPVNLIIIGGIVLFVGLLSGLFPAFFISGFAPGTVLKTDKLPRSSANLLRKGLIVLQFVISAFLIISTILVYQQMHLFRNKQLGFDKEQVLIVKLYGDFKERVNRNAQAFKNELTRNPAVLAAGQSSNIIGDGLSIERVTPLNPPPGKEYSSVSVMRVDEDYLNVLHIPLKEGRNFSRVFNDSASFIINEKAAELLELKNPIGAPVVNQTMNIEGKVVGVIKDYHFASLHDQIQPLVLLYKPQWTSNLLLKIRPENIPATLEFVKSTIEKLAPNTLFSYSFLDERMDTLYSKEDNMSRIMKIFSGLAIVISCLGLFGLVAHELKIRTREIGIRKVLGASVASLVGLFTGSFLKLVVAGILIASPLAWYMMDTWLQDFAYRITIKWWVFAATGFLLILLALLTAGFQSVKAALMNPVKSLRAE